MSARTNEMITAWTYRKGELMRKRFGRFGILKLFAGLVFKGYKKLFGIKEEEILFTSNKIASTNRTWVLNDNRKELKEVKLIITPKTVALSFKGIEDNPGRDPIKYSVEIPVPKEELENAQKICRYFREILDSPASNV